VRGRHRRGCPANDRRSIYLAISAEEGVESRRSRIYGGCDWVRLGAVELGLDCLRRYLQGLPVSERTDFERV
jgi:nicotinamide-nucleotide amidase